MTHRIFRGIGAVAGWRRLALTLLLSAILGSRISWAWDDSPPTVEFNRDIRPILSDTCFQCHGPDQAQRKADLRLDVEASALADLGEGRRAIVPGDVDKSELVRRISSADESERMPPVDSGKALTLRQIELLRLWVAQGAKWQKHWSLLPPVRPSAPEVRGAAWVRSPIDAFVLARLEQEGLTPSPEADKTTLIRRVSLDLTGLPPTPAEVDAYLADETPEAYERVVDRLLASPRFGERMASRWLDAARYADTNGYQSDGERFMWRWRDWVIEAFNSNMPFDQFTVEQLAGDLLPNCTLEQRVATGFNRNHRGNAEGGIIPEEYAVEYVVDRVDTTATVWLGLTLGCTRCHDHKFDPFTQRDFYRLFAYFNNVPEKGRAIKYGNSPPMIPAPTREQQQQLAELTERLKAAETAFAQLGPELDSAQAEWEKSADASPPIDWTVRRELVVQYALDGDAADGCRADAPGKFQDGEAAFVPGRLGQAGDFDGQRYVEAGDLANFGFYEKFSLGAWIMPQEGQGGAIISRMTDAPQADGYYLMLDGGKLQLNLIKRWLDDALRVETAETIPAGQWTHVMATYDGSRVAGGVRFYVNGRPAELKVVLDDLNQTFATKEPLRIGGGGGPEGRFHGAIDDARVYGGVLTPEEVALVATTERIEEILAVPSAERSAAQAHKLRSYFLEQSAPEAIRQAHAAIADVSGELQKLIEGFPTTMVMEEMSTPRETFVLLRGEYDKHGDQVSAGVPGSLPPLPEGVPNNRLGFARWLVDPANPLTARVAVNRYWQSCFGTGLVKTVEDFGSQGEWPTHPELLDWLASELIGSGWDVKGVQRTIVTSATYRQSSQVTPELWQRDPENRLFARGPRFRLSAETIRDQALAASGLLVEKLGGPSVRPYQPEGLWKDLTGLEDYVQDHGEGLYRRSLYTYWKRTVAPPAMMTFDAAGRETCIVRQTRTNTPLQALILMNEVTFVEAARALAQRVMMEAGATPEERITLAFRLVLVRPPSTEELGVLVGGWREHLSRYQQDPQAALALLAVGESPRNEQLEPAEHAAYAAVCGLILNLDETVTKE